MVYSGVGEWVGGLGPTWVGFVKGEGKEEREEIKDERVGLTYHVNN